MTQELDPQDLALADALDRAQDDRLASELGPIFWRFGHGGVDKSLAKAEQHRVSAIIRRDQADRAQSETLALAELKIRDGLSVDLSDTVIAPTPEWLAQGESAVFTPRVVDGTSRVLTTRRRRTVTTVERMYQSGKLTDEQFRVCVWYAERHEAAGLDGRYKTNYLSLTGNVGGAGGMSQAPMAQHHYEMQARLEFRAAREEIPARLRRFFDAIVISDVPIRRAVRFARCRTGGGSTIFRECCEALVAFVEGAGLDLRRSDGGD